MNLLHSTELLLLFVAKMINGKNNEAMLVPESNSLSGKVLKVVIGQVCTLIHIQLVKISVKVYIFMSYSLAQLCS